MMKNKAKILADDMDFIKRSLENFTGYDLAGDIAARMQTLGINKSGLAARAHVSHTTVGKWLKKGVKPRGKERVKELGMALSMDHVELNQFLLQNDYPRLYSKNPLDAACRFVLSQIAGNEHIVEVYRSFIMLYELDTYSLKHEPLDIDTELLSRELANIKTLEGFAVWIKDSDKYFRAFDKAYIAPNKLINFIRPYMDEQNIHEQFTLSSLLISSKNLLYPLNDQKEVAVRGLRAKLIVLGLYENMTEDEIDMMLRFARLQPLTEPTAPMDQVILMALRCAHERYPYFELSNAEKALKSLRKDPAPDMLRFYKSQRRRAEELVESYDGGVMKSDERVFVKAYTDGYTSGVLRYMRELLLVLAKNGVISASEANVYVARMRTYHKKKSMRAQASATLEN